MSEIILISERGGEFWDSNRLGEASKYGRLEQGKLTVFDQQEFEDTLSSLAGKRVLVLIHGLNNPKDQVVSNYVLTNANVSQLIYTKNESFLYRCWRVFSSYTGLWEAQTEKPYDAIIGITWPSFETPLRYYDGKKHAHQVAPRVATHLTKISKHVSNLDVMTHSMGTLVLFEALKSSSQLNLNHVFALAAAVPAKTLSKGNTYESISEKCHKLFVFHSSKDEALLWPFYLAEGGLTALGLTGAEHEQELASNIYSVNCSCVAHHHSDYFSNPALYKFIERHHNGEHSLLETATTLRLDSNGNVTK